MITDNDIKVLFLEAKQSEIKAEYYEEMGTTQIEKNFFRGKKEAYNYMAKKIEVLMRYKDIEL